MNYITFEVNNRTYKLRLSTRNLVLLEKQLGCSPLAIFGDGERIPTVTEMAQILHASLLQYNHGMNINDAYDLLDQYVEEGNSIVDFIPVIIELYKASGIIPKDKVEEKN